MLTPSYEITCDGAIWAEGSLHACRHLFAAETKNEAQAEAMERGWVRVGPRHYCKPCASAQRNEDSEPTDGEAECAELHEMLAAAREGIAFLKDRVSRAQEKCDTTAAELAEVFVEVQEKTAWLAAENSRLWAALNAAGRAAGRLAFAEVWIEATKIRVAILVSDDKEGEEEGAHAIKGLIESLWEDNLLVDGAQAPAPEEDAAT